MSWWPPKREADWMGDGGGCSSLTGVFGVAVSSEVGEVGEGTESERLVRATGDLLPLPGTTEVVSSFSSKSPLESIVELLGLSVLLDPGILDRRERKEREESLVSDLLKDG